MQKLIIDTDPGQDIDDLLALFFALRRPELDVRAITTVMQDAARRARLVKRLLRYLDRTDIPVAAGMELPLRSLSEAEFRARADLPCCLNHYAFAEPEDPRDVPGPLDAVDLIVRTVDANAGDIALACIGPLTNVACALRKCPGIAAKIQYIAMMGGELTLNRLEHNVASDYTAADIVVNSGIPIFMGTWDVTRRFVLSMDDVALFRRHRAPVCQALAAAVQRKAGNPARSCTICSR